MKRELKKISYITFRIFRLSFLYVIIMILCCNSVYALDLLRPPASEIQKWQPIVGFEYSYGSTDIKLSNGKWESMVNGQFHDSGQAVDLTINKVDMDSINLYLGYGIERNWEVFFRLGTSHSEFTNSFVEENEKFDSDYVPSIGAGLRTTFIDNLNLKIGGVFQVGWAKYSGLLNAPLWLNPSFVNMDMTNMQVSIGALYQWTKGFSIYGGPVFRYSFGKFNADLVSFASDNSGVPYVSYTKYKWDIKSESDYGGYIGSKIVLEKNFDLNLEYQLTGNADVYGAGIIWRF